MDILNFISWIRGKRKVTTVDPAKTVIPLGIKDGRRDDDYLAVAMTVEDFAAQIAPEPAYKVYTALLTQAGIDPPVATVLENTIGNIVWSRGSKGYYVGTSSNLFTSDKTGFFIQPSSNLSNTGFFETNNISNNAVEFTFALLIGGTADDVLFKTMIEIRVYN